MTIGAHCGGLASLAAAAAAPQSGSRFGGVLPWIGVLLLLVCAGAVAIHLARRMARKDAPPEGFTLEDLRRLHGSGQLSDEEFEKARAAVIERAKRS